MKKRLFLAAIITIFVLSGCKTNLEPKYLTTPDDTIIASAGISMDDPRGNVEIPAYQGEPYVVLNDNIPFFNEIKAGNWEEYSELDSLGRCGVASACICKELMPTEERGEIGSIKPSGWKQNKYPEQIKESPSFLYNRCHLIAYCLAGENANKKNLITGTRYLNVKGMLPFETMVAEYMDNHPNNHVMYRVTPVFEGNNLLASGVQIEAASVEDTSIRLNVFCFNVQPGIEIDYATGANKVA